MGVTRAVWRLFDADRQSFGRLLTFNQPSTRIADGYCVHSLARAKLSRAPVVPTAGAFFCLRGVAASLDDHRRRAPLGLLAGDGHASQASSIKRHEIDILRGCFAKLQAREEHY